MSLEFQERFDPDRPDIPESDQKEASELFEGIVDSTLLSYPASTAEVVPDTAMELDLTPIEFETGIDSAKVAIVYNKSHTDRFVYLTHTKKDDKPQRTSIYRLYGGTTVRRFDKSDQKVDGVRDSSFLTNKEQFEQSIGINGRPVGVAEIQKVQEQLAGMLPK
jgi:hypothetical protein